jgi:hypothetical protein
MARSLIVFALAALVAAPVLAQETDGSGPGAGGGLPATVDSEAPVRAALASETQMNFPDVTLQDAVDFLSEYHKVRIVIDKKALADAGVDLESPIDVRISGVSLGGGLSFMLRELDLTWVVEKNLLVITTIDAAQAAKSTRTYGVADLLMGATGMHGPERGGIDDLAAAVALVMNEDAGDKPAPAPAEAPADKPMGEAADEVLARAGHDVIVRLPEHQHAFLHPRIRPFRGQLIVKGSFHEHERIGELLDELRQGAKDMPLPPPVGLPRGGVIEAVPGTLPALPPPGVFKEPIKIKPVTPEKKP